MGNIMKYVIALPLPQVDLKLITLTNSEENGLIIKLLLKIDYVLWKRPNIQYKDILIVKVIVGVVFSLKKSISITLYILSLIAVVLLTMGIFILIITIQEKLFVPNDYLMWTFNYPTSRFVFIYELYLFLGLLQGDGSSVSKGKSIP